MTRRKPYDDMPHAHTTTAPTPSPPMNTQETVAFSSKESESASSPAIRLALGLAPPPRISIAAPPRFSTTTFPLMNLMSFSSSGCGCGGGGVDWPLHPEHQSARPRDPRAVELIAQHRPWETMDNMALIIIDQTYTAAREIVGAARAAPAVVELRCAVDTADPDSPVLTVQASATHCCIAFNTPRGDAAPYSKYTSPKQKIRPSHRLARCCISVSNGTLYVTRTDGGGGGVRGRGEYWNCADIRPDIACGGAFAILDTVMLRLRAAIWAEDSLLEIARAIDLRGPAVEQIVRARTSLDTMRREMDLPALMRRTLQKRRHFTEITCRKPASSSAAGHDEADDEAETLMKRLKKLNVG